jgi:hypothetical protein
VQACSASTQARTGYTISTLNPAIPWVISTQYVTQKHCTSLPTPLLTYQPPSHTSPRASERSPSPPLEQSSRPSAAAPCTTHSPRKDRVPAPAPQPPIPSLQSPASIEQYTLLAPGDPDYTRLDDRAALSRWPRSSKRHAYLLLMLCGCCASIRRRKEGLRCCLLSLERMGGVWDDREVALVEQRGSVLLVCWWGFGSW